MRFEAFNPTDGFPDSYSNNASTLGHLQQIHIPSIEHTNIQKEIIAEEQAYDKLVNILNTSQLVLKINLKSTLPCWKHLYKTATQIYQHMS